MPDKMRGGRARRPAADAERTRYEVGAEFADIDKERDVGEESPAVRTTPAGGAMRTPGTPKTDREKENR